MTHTIKDRQKLQARVRSIRGQLEAVERTPDAETGCNNVMHLLASTRAAMPSLLVKVVLAPRCFECRKYLQSSH